MWAERLEFYMDANIKTTMLEVSSEIFCGENTFSAESDLIVPDNMPDILSVLQISANCATSVCDAQTDRVLLTGNVFFNILYLADTPRREVKAINAKAVFSNIFSAPSVRDDMPVLSSVNVSSVSFRLANCRKLSVHADVCGQISVSSNSQLTIPTEIEGAELCTAALSCSVIKARGCAQETVADSFTLSPSKAPAVEILRDEVCLADKSVKVISNKAIVKGSVSAVILYAAEGGIEKAKADIPFTKVVNVEGLNDAMDVECRIDIQGWETELTADENGEKRTVDVETMLYFTLIGRITTSCGAITDAYYPGAELDCTRSALSLTVPETKEIEDCGIKGTIKLPAAVGDIETVHDIKGRPNITRIFREGSDIVIEGTADVSLLFRTSNPEAPVSSYSYGVDFSHRMNGERYSALPSVTAELKHMSYSIGAGNSIEVRGIAALTVSAPSACEQSVITDVKLREEEKRDAPSILISYITEEKSLWDIAKGYNISRAKLMAANDIKTEDELKNKRALVIPR